MAMGLRRQHRLYSSPGRLTGMEHRTIRLVIAGPVDQLWFSCTGVDIRCSRLTLVLFNPGCPVK